jgi:hypothetical protein
VSACAGDGCTHPDCTHARRWDAVVVKYDGAGRPVYADDPRLGNRAERRAAARGARKACRR